MSLSYLPSVRSDGHVCALHRHNFISGERSLAGCLAGGNLDGYAMCAPGSAMVYKVSPGTRTTFTIKILLYFPPFKQILRLSLWPTCSHWRKASPTLLSTIFASLSSSTLAPMSWYVPCGVLPSQRLTRFVRPTGLASEPAYHHSRSVEGVMVFCLRYKRPLILR